MKKEIAKNQYKNMPQADCTSDGPSDNDQPIQTGTESKPDVLIKLSAHDVTVEIQITITKQQEDCQKTSDAMDDTTENLRREDSQKHVTYRPYDPPIPPIWSSGDPLLYGTVSENG